MPCIDASVGNANPQAAVAVLYSGQWRPVLRFPGIVQNHVRLFNALFQHRNRWDVFMFVDVGDAAGNVDATQCRSPLLEPVVRALAPVAAATWTPNTDGEVPVEQVAGFCKGKATPRHGSRCLRKNATHHFNSAFLGYRRGEAVARVMREKHHIYRAYELMRHHVERHRSHRPYEIVVRMRPDCWFDNQYTALPGQPFGDFTPLRPVQIDALVRKGLIIVPREWAWGGVNDRFAIGSYAQMRSYAYQYVHMQHGWHKGAPPASAAGAASVPAATDERHFVQDCPGWIHSESFTRCNLVRHGITFAQLPIGMYLVRSDGRKQVLGHMKEGGLHSCSCVSWRSPAVSRRASPEKSYREKCGKQLNLTTIASDPDWANTAFVGFDWKYLQEKPCRVARWWREKMTTGHHEWPVYSVGP